MAKVIVDVSMSLDGFVAGPNVRAAEPMGDGGERLHAWMGAGGPDGPIHARERTLVNGAVGATIVGRTTFDLGHAPWGGTPWPGIPAFVVTHRPQQGFVGANGGKFSFGGLTEAVEWAKEAAGSKDALVLGPDIARQLIGLRLADELWIHLVPILLGAGTRLLAGIEAELAPLWEPVGRTVTHLHYAVVRP